MVRPKALLSKTLQEMLLWFCVTGSVRQKGPSEPFCIAEGVSILKDSSAYG